MRTLPQPPTISKGGGGRVCVRTSNPDPGQSGCAGSCKLLQDLGGSSAPRPGSVRPWLCRISL
eukprot:6880734-Pyramimonas_sp.AAC.1